MKNFKGVILFLLLIVGAALPVLAQNADDNAACATNTNPVANRLAEAFDVEVSAIIELHCAGTGFGDIARIYRASELSDTPIVDISAMRADGMGWGQIARELGLHPRDLAPGRIMRNGNGNGNANGNANGRGNGRGNGNANGNSNGRSNGRGGSSGGSGGSD